ncbi:PREDICTED: taste receptor type 2 member 39-like [Chrysochloris asiatica]|uniref:Taste receptor type 2 n=1 Tax=Chrysochloris asiatica TaxID=185453 RepID=A0A9B0TA92_CHRAS|nr:PREDICTED: taste receptor type 2 member 39-like [Chrysochloris asiatica]
MGKENVSGAAKDLPITPRNYFYTHTNTESEVRMPETCNYPENKLPPLLFTFVLAVIGTECVIGIIANGFIVAVNAVDWVRNKAVATSDRILFFLSSSRIALESFMMLEILLSSAFPSLYYLDVVNDTFKVSFMFLNYCSLWFAAWLSFFYFVKISDFSHPLFLKLKWRLSGWVPWLLWLSVLTSLGYSVLFSENIYAVDCSNSFPMRSSNSTHKKYFMETNMVNLVLLYNLGIFPPLIIFILAATLLIVSLRRHALHMESNATGSRDPSMQAHLGAIKSISYFLILYIFNAITLFLYMSNIFQINSPWNILCKVFMAAYPSGHSVLMILDNHGLRRAWKRLKYQVHVYLKGQKL